MPPMHWGDCSSALSTFASSRPEVALLLCAARTRPDGAAVQRIRGLLAEPIDWPGWVGLAVSHDVLGLAYRTINTISGDTIPEQVRAPLKEYVRRRGEWSQHLAAELPGLLDLLHGHGIAAVPVKGPVIASLVYGDVALRECDDLDVLIPRDDAPRAKDLLRSSGYELKTALDARGFPVGSENAEYRFRNQRSRATVELCWRLTPHYFLRGLTLPALGPRRRTVSLAGQAVTTFPPEEHLVVLCAHGTKHMWSVLRWLCDVAELLRTFPQLRWTRVQVLAAESGCWRSVAAGAALAHAFLGAPLDREVCQRVTADPSVKSLVVWSALNLFRKQQPRGLAMDDREQIVFDIMEEFHRRRYYLRATEHLSDRLWNTVLFVRWMLSVLFVPGARDRAVVSLPTPLTFLYVPFRLLRLTLRYSTFWGRRLFVSCERSVRGG